MYSFSIQTSPSLLISRSFLDRCTLRLCLAHGSRIEDESVYMEEEVEMADEKEQMDPVSSAKWLLSRSADKSFSAVSSICTTLYLEVDAMEREDVERHEAKERREDVEVTERHEARERDDGEVGGNCCGVNENKLLLLIDEVSSSLS